MDSYINSFKIDCIIFESSLHQPEDIGRLFEKYRDNTYFILLPKFIILQEAKDIRSKEYMLFAREFFYKPLNVPLIKERVSRSMNEWKHYKDTCGSFNGYQEEIKKLNDDNRQLKQLYGELQENFNNFNNQIKDELMLQRMLMDKNEELKKKVTGLEGETQKFKTLIRLIIQGEDRKDVVYTTSEEIEGSLFRLIHYIHIFKTHFTVYYLVLRNFKKVRQRVGKEMYNPLIVELTENIASHLREKDMVGMLSDNTFVVTFYNGYFKAIDEKFESMIEQLRVYNFQDTDLELKFEHVYHDVNYSRTSSKEILRKLKNKYERKIKA